MSSRKPRVSGFRGRRARSGALPCDNVAASRTLAISLQRRAFRRSIPRRRSVTAPPHRRPAFRRGMVVHQRRSANWSVDPEGRSRVRPTMPQTRERARRVGGRGIGRKVGGADGRAATVVATSPAPAGAAAPLRKAPPWLQADCRRDEAVRRVRREAALRRRLVDADGDGPASERASAHRHRTPSDRRVIEVSSHASRSSAGVRRRMSRLA